MASDLSEKGIQEKETISDLLGKGDFNTALLILKGLSQEQLSKLTLKIKRTPLHYACQHGRIEVAEELITNFQCSIESKDENGCTPLHIAAQYGQLDALKYMLHLLFTEDVSSLSIKLASKLSHALMSMYKQRLTDRHTDLNSHTPLHAASIHGHLDIVQFLLCEIGCDPVSTNSEGQSCLHLAAQHGHLPMMRYLLEEVGCDMTLADKNGRSPTYLAAGGGHLNVVRYMIEDKGADPHSKTARGWITDNFIFAPGRSLVHTASREGHLTVITYLVDHHRCDPSSRDVDDITPLYLACLEGHMDIVVYLISDLKCDPNCTSSDGKTCLHAASVSGRLDIIKFLINDNHCEIKPNAQGDTPLHIAAYSGKLDVVKFLIEDLNCDADVRGQWGKIPLHHASENGHLDVVQYLVDIHHCDPLCPDEGLDNPLYLASANGHLDVVRYFTIVHHCNPQVKNAYNSTPFHLAALSGKLDVVKFFIEDLNCDVNIRGQSERIPLHHASENGHLDVVQYLIETCHCDPWCPDEKQVTSLHLASANGHLEIVMYFTTFHYCNPLEKNAYSNTPLHFAALNGKLNVVKFFIEDLNCDADIRGQFGRIPLHHASENGHLCVVLYLLETCQCDPLFQDEKKFTSLHLASAEGHLDVVTYFTTVNHCNPLVKNAYNSTPLHLAALNGKLDVVKFFIEDLNCGANIRGYLERIPLHHASENGHLDVVLYLVETCHCDPQYPDENFDNSLHLASANGHLEIVRYFIIVHHCNPIVKNTYNDTPLHLAAFNGKLDIVKFFIEDLNCDADIRGHLEKIPIHYASENGYLGVVQHLVETHHSDPLCLDKNQETPLHIASTKGHLHIVKYLLLSGVINLSPIVTKTFKVLSNAASKNGNTHVASFLDETLINMPIKIFIVGDSGSGKSTLVKSLTKESDFFGKYRTVSGVQPLTPGIVPTAFQSTVFGAVNIYDFAGHKEYYASHEIIFHYASQSIVLIAVNTSLSEVEVKKQLLYWLSLMCSSVKTTSHKIHVIVIGSHADKMKSIAKIEVRGLIDSLLSIQTSINYLGFIHCDCRYSVSTEMTTLRQKLETACIFKRQSIMRTESDYSIRLCRSLKHYLQHNLSYITIITVSELSKHLSQLKASQKLIQLTDQNILFQTCEKLNSHGYLLFLLNDRSLEESLLILNESVVLSKVHASIGVLRKGVTNKIGMFEESKLEESIRSSLLIDVMNPHLAIKYLTFTQVCTEIDPTQLINTPDDIKVVTHYFFPNLVLAERPTDLWFTEKESYTKLYTWCLECTSTRQFFTPRYLHTLFIQLVKCESAHARCRIWKNGILLSHSNSTRCVIEMTDKVIYLTMQCAKDCKLFLVKQRSMLISLMKSLKNRICPHLELKEFLLYPQSSYPPVISTKISLDEIASSVRSDFPCVVCEDEKFEQVKLSTLFVFDAFYEFKKSTFQEIFSKSEQIISPDMLKVLCESRLGEVFRQKERLREFTYNQLYQELLKYTIFTDGNLYVS